jgi:LTXXQ motif family protein
MRRRTILVIGLLAAAVLAPDVASAQFSLTPGGIMGAVTRPFRDMFGRLGRHRPMPHRNAANEARASPSQKPQSGSELGDVGPMTWPAAYSDVLGYTFWPKDYIGELRGHGFGDIATTIVGPLPAHRGATTVGAASADTQTDAGGSTKNCNDSAATQSDWPAKQIEDTAQLNGPQKAVLDKLRATIADATKAIKAGCQDTASMPPMQRLKFFEQRLWAVHDAGSLVREPLKVFYDSLTDEQKAKFKAPQQQEPADKAAGAAAKRQAQMCYAQGSGDIEKFLRQIQQAVRPTEAQRASVETLHQKTEQMGKLLLAACAQPVPETPIDRLDAADNRLTTMNYAATTVDIALNDFYAQLSDDQKAKFDSLGR